MEKVGRNDPCPCGSGKKYKNCHQQENEQSKGIDKAWLLGILIVAFLIIGSIGYYFNSKNAANRPAGAAPAGKVWSEEHGHYH